MIMAWAVASEKAPPIQIESDQVTHHTKDNTTIYDGNVVLTRGALRVAAENMTIITKQERIVRVSASGAPVQIRHQLANDEPITGTAETVEYNLDEAELVFLGKASLTQKNNSIQGDRILYQVHTQIASVDPPDTDKGRVQTIIQPEALKSEK